MHPDSPTMKEALDHVQDPELRAAIARAHAATILTPEEQQAEDLAKAKQERAKKRREVRDCAYRAMVRAVDGGEWGDDVRRAVDQLLFDHRRNVATLVEWARRAMAGTETTPIEALAVRAVFEDEDMLDALKAADKIIRDAEKERRAAPAKAGAR